MPYCSVTLSVYSLWNNPSGWIFIAGIYRGKGSGPFVYDILNAVVSHIRFRTSELFAAGWEKLGGLSRVNLADLRTVLEISSNIYIYIYAYENLTKWNKLRVKDRSWNCGILFTRRFTRTLAWRIMWREEFHRCHHSTYNSTFRWLSSIIVEDLASAFDRGSSSAFHFYLRALIT